MSDPEHLEEENEEEADAEAPQPLSDDGSEPLPDAESPAGDSAPEPFQAFDDSPDSLDSLQEQKRIAIHELDFELARQLQDRITALNQKTADDLIASFHADFRQSCDECATRHARASRQILRKFHRDELAARGTITDRFVELQIRHKLEIRSLEDVLYEDFKKRMSRPIQPAVDLAEKARYAATHNDFDTAQSLRDKAREIEQAEQDKRKDNFGIFYKAQVNGLLDKQRSELTELSEKLRKDIESIEKLRQAQMGQEAALFVRNLEKGYRIARKHVRPEKGNAKGLDDSESVASFAPKQVLVVTAETRASVLKDLEAAFDDTLKRFGIGADEVAPLSSRPASRVASRPSGRNSVFRGTLS
jgi:hypothetical protein